MDISINHIHESWNSILGPVWEVHKDKIKTNIENDLNQFSMYPPPHEVFHAFSLCKFEDIKVVIIGMDPYIKQNEAHGLAFSVRNGCTTPPSLRNIFKELKRSLGIDRKNTDLTDWAEQGVLLLNTALTVREGCSGSHTSIWKDFTKDVISQIGKSTKHCVYMLWGNHAQAFGQYIDSASNLILKHTHPSPLSRKPFEGNMHFVLCNEYLVNHDKTPIVWG